MINISLKKSPWTMFLLLFCVSGYAVAQVPDTSQATWEVDGVRTVDTCYSTWIGYSPMKENSSIVRCNRFYRVVHIQRQEGAEQWNVSHTFVLERAGIDAEVAVNTYFNRSGSKIDITNMRLYDDTCYFCGTIHYQGVSTTYGVVGFFSIPNMYTLASPMYFLIMNETSQFSRLAISRAVIDNKLTTVVSIIGKKFTDNTDCLVELTHTGSTPLWTNRIDWLDQPRDVIFSDLLNTGDSITLLSQYKCANNIYPGYSGYDFSHQIFLLARFGLDGCYRTCNSVGPHYMMHYLMDLSDNCSYHYSDAPMNLFHIDDQNKKFGVAFGVRKTNVDVGGMRLFTFHNARQYDSSLYYKTGVPAAIKDIGNLYTSTDLLVLSTDSDHPRGVLSSPEFGSTSHNVTLLSSPTYRANSLAQKNLGDYFDITGRDGSVNYTLYTQYGRNFSRPTCFSVENREYTVFPEKQADLLRVEWNSIKENDVEWERVDLVSVEIVKDTVCQRCIP